MVRGSWAEVKGGGLDGRQSPPYSLGMSMLRTAAAALSLALVPAPGSTAQEPKTAGKIGYYVDSRRFNTVCLELSSSNLPWGLSLWGFTDFNSAQHDAHRRFDPAGHLSRYDVSKELEPGWVRGFRGLGLQAEYFDMTGPRNAVLRLGPTFRHGLPALGGRAGWLVWRVFPIETDGTGGLVGLVLFVPLAARLHLDGFFDYHVNKDGPGRVVTEPQLNFKVNDHLSAVVEFRYDGFVDAVPGLDGFGVAPGLHLAF